MTVPESDLEPYTEQKEDFELGMDSEGFFRPDTDANGNPIRVRIPSQEVNKHFDNILKNNFSKERRLNIAKDFVSVLLGRLNYDPFTAQINCCCSDGVAVNPYINIARIALSAADALIAEAEKGETI